jgi:2-desacetyl-2-hydroxyethyl bacteriochlorophyllide A dehydrogenase
MDSASVDQSECFMSNTVVCRSPGVLVMEDRPRPARGAGEVLLRVRRVGICGTDMHIFRGTQPYLAYPRVMGHELSGEVVEANATNGLAAGDQVYVTPYLACGTCAACAKGGSNACMNIEVLGVHRDGALTEYLSVPDRFVFRADGVTLDEAAMVEFLAIGRHAVRRGDVRPGHTVLVVGAGPIGIGAALFARLAGGRVTTLDARADRLAFTREHMKVEATIDANDDVPARVRDLTGGDGYDVIFDCTGNAAAMEAGFLHLAHGGRYVLVSIVAADIRFSDPEFHKREATLLGSRNALPEDFDDVLAAMRDGLVPTAALATHRARLADLPAVFERWMDPAAGVIKAIVEL